MNKNILPLFLASILPWVAAANELTVESDLVVEGTLNVQGNDGVLFEGEGPSWSSPGPGAIPAEGAGTRMMWYPRKAAFRVGQVSWTHWDDQNVGEYSTAWGMNTTASGEYSTAWGTNTTASGNGSTAWGAHGYTTGEYSTAWGIHSVATGQYSTAWGEGAYATGLYSTAWGMYTSGSGEFSTAWGFDSRATAEYSTAWGRYTHASGTNSTAFGRYTRAASLDGVALGRLNLGGGNATQWIETDPLFEIGNGTSSINRTNALTVLKNGRTTLENKFWDDQDPTAIPTSSDASDGEALVVKGHARFAGRVTIEPQGDIPMFGQ